MSIKRNFGVHIALAIPYFVVRLQNRQSAVQLAVISLVEKLARYGERGPYLVYTC
jgi:hypothetical protein